MTATFTCPRCNATSAHPMDLAEGYCGACHAWTGRSGRAGGTGLASHDVGYYDDPPAERCRSVLDADGQVVAMVRGDRELSARSREAMLEMVAAVRRQMMAEDTQELQARAEAAWVRNHERLLRARARAEQSRSRMRTAYRRRAR